MKRVNIPKLQNNWAALKMKFPKTITLDLLKDECKKLGISLGNNSLQGYVKSGTLQRVRHGIYMIDADASRVVKACDINAQYRKSLRKNTVKVQVFNAKVEHNISLEMAIEFLQQRGYFIHKPKKGEKITITREVKFLLKSAVTFKRVAALNLC